MIKTWSRGNANDCMSEDMLTELAGVIRGHPWFRARTKFCLGLLQRLHVRPPARVLDAGCGWGINLEALEQRGYRAVGLDISERMLRRLDRPGRELIAADLGQRPPADAEPFDAVLALDVIEHLDDDRPAIACLEQLTRPGGVAIVSVPALPKLFSHFDAVQGHRRRYLPDTLRHAFENSDFHLEQILWWGSWLVPFFDRQRHGTEEAHDLPPLEAYRRYLKVPSLPVSLLLRIPFAFEQFRALRGKTRTGTSLFAVARRVGNGRKLRAGETV